MDPWTGLGAIAGDVLYIGRTIENLAAL